jgi:integrase
MVSLETGDIQEAITTAAKIRAVPLLNPSTTLLAEIRAHLKERTKSREYTRSTAENKFWKLRRWVLSLPRGTTLPAVNTALLQAQYDVVLEESSDATAHKFLMTVRAFLGWAVEKGKIRSNPAIYVKSVPASTSARILFCERELRDRLIAECPREDLAFVLHCGFHAGLRKNEIIQAVPAWFLPHTIDLRDTPDFRFNDKKRRRKIPLRESFRLFLDRYGLREPFMLRPDIGQGKSIYRYDFSKPFRDYMAGQGVPWVTPHVMRHTFASLLVMKGTSVFKVATWLGDSVRTTEVHYAHLSPRDVDIED